MKVPRFFHFLIAAFFFVFISCVSVSAQSTEFIYQGKLADNNLPPTASYDFEFRLFSVETSGTALATQQRAGVVVSNGVFTVRLDFGNQFNGTNRWLEIGVRPTGSSGTNFTTLNPRQFIASTPYAIRSLSSASADTATNATNATNADTLDGVNSSDFVQTNSTLFIRNQTLQQTADFNVGGTGTANIINAQTQYNVGGSRLISIAGSNNLFAGIGTGAANTTGTSNSFFGSQAGAANTAGFSNSFFGDRAGSLNTTGSANSFFGLFAGNRNTTGNNNSFFGVFAGDFNTTGSNNTIIGDRADVGANNLTNATAIGHQAFVTQSNSLVLGSINGVNGADATVNVGIGVTAPTERLHVVGNGLFNGNLTASGQVGIGVTVPQQRLSVSDGVNIDQNDLNDGTTLNTLRFGFGNANGSSGEAIGSKRTVGGNRYGLDFYTNSINRMSISNAGVVSIFNIPGGGSLHLCRSASNQIQECSSSLRYKTNMASFHSGMKLINQLQPISYNWKEGGMADVGFGAEDVARINPLFVTYNKDGKVEGVKYDRLSVAFVNAFKEQQAQIEQQQQQLEVQKAINQNLQTKLQQQQQQIDALINLICTRQTKAEICK